MDKYQDFISRLSEIEQKSAPKELFYEGNFDLLTDHIKVSVVGSRKISENGKRRTAFITNELVKRGITVVSGLADGVDTIAHQTAIENGGKTIAVLGTPLDKSYPASNKNLQAIIMREHLAVSQFPIGSKVYPGNFPTRNKTMALISEATIIIEASENSGTRHQAWEAIKLGKQVLIMSNVFETAPIWANETVEYGAHELTNENYQDLLDGLTDLYIGTIDASFF